MPLLDDEQLERSEIVANRAMNRDRGIVGVDSYAKELRFDPLAFVAQRVASRGRATWLDLCCGSGHALMEAAHEFQAAGLSDCVEIVGVDLVDMFPPLPSEIRFLNLQAVALRQFTPGWPCDLITCVHGLHYIGDKLRAIQRAVSWLSNDGYFAASFDVGSIRNQTGKSLASVAGKFLKAAGISYRSRLKLIECRGRREFLIPFNYLGADDRAGPNYTRQPAVAAYYKRRTT